MPMINFAFRREKNIHLLQNSVYQTCIQEKKVGRFKRCIKLEFRHNQQNFIFLQNMS